MNIALASLADKTEEGDESVDHDTGAINEGGSKGE
jgi:hypothetical protein